MAEQESQFGMSPEKIEELRKRHAEEQKGKAGDPIPLSEISLITKSLEKEQRPLEPSGETAQYIEEEGRMLTDKQIAAAKLSAFFFEQCASAANLILRKERAEVFDEEDSVKADRLLGDLTLRYEDILERINEYPAAREMINELRGNVPGFVVKNSNAIFAWLDISKRIHAFHHALFSKEGKSEYNVQNFHRFLDSMAQLVLGRVPMEALRKETGFGLGAGAETKKEKDRYFSKTLSMPPKEVLELGDRLRNFIKISHSIRKDFSLTSDFSIPSVKIFRNFPFWLSIEGSTQEMSFSLRLSESGAVTFWCEIKGENKKEVIQKIEAVSPQDWLSFLGEIVESSEKKI